MELNGLSDSRQDYEQFIRGRLSALVGLERLFVYLG